MPWWKQHRQKQIVADEKLLIEEFIKNNEAIVQKAGGEIRRVSLSASVGGSETRLPYRYIVGVYDRGKESKPVYAVVDVSRQKGGAKFILVCITPFLYDTACGQDPE